MQEHSCPLRSKAAHRKRAVLCRSTIKPRIAVQPVVVGGINSGSSTTTNSAGTIGATQVSQLYKSQNSSEVTAGLIAFFLSFQRHVLKPPGSYVIQPLIFVHSTEFSNPTNKDLFPVGSSLIEQQTNCSLSAVIMTST